MKWLQQHADRLGIAAALLCTIHCLAFPVLILLQAQISESLHDHWHGLDYVFLAIGLVAVIYASRSTCSKLNRWLLWGSFTLLALSILLQHEVPSFHYLAIGSAFLLIGIHVRNLIVNRKSC